MAIVDRRGVTVGQTTTPDRSAPNADAAIKAPARVATTGNHSLSGLAAIDGVTPVAGDRILVWKQTTTTGNGIYLAASGAWVRSSDCSINGDLRKGTLVFVTDGNTYAGVEFKVTTTDPIVFETSAIVFAEASLAPDLDATLAANSDHRYASQKAVKAYADTKLDDSQLDTDGLLTANSDEKIPSQKAVKTYADNLLAANDAMVLKGTLDCSANPNYPAANAGHTYKVSAAGKIGGASGLPVEIGDTLYCIVDDSAAGDQATVGANWVIVQDNIDLDSDATLSANSDGRVSTQKAVKTYVKSKTAVNVIDFGNCVPFTDITSVLQAAVDGIPDDVATLTFPDGVYNISSTIDLGTKSRLTLRCRARWSTILILANGSDCDMFNAGDGLTYTQYVNFENLHLVGNSANQSDGTALINFDAIEFPSLINCRINDAYEAGVKFDASDGGISAFPLVTGCTFTKAGGDSIVLGPNSFGNQISNNIIRTAGNRVDNAAGIFCDNNQETVIIGNQFDECDVGIHLFSVDETKVVGNFFEKSATVYMARLTLLPV